MQTLFANENNDAMLCRHTRSSACTWPLARYANNGPINNQQSTIAVPTSCHNGARCVLNIGFRMASLPADGAITYWHLISRVAIASPEPNNELQLVLLVLNAVAYSRAYSSLRRRRIHLAPFVVNMVDQTYSDTVCVPRPTDWCIRNVGGTNVNIVVTARQQRDSLRWCLFDIHLIICRDGPCCGSGIDSVEAR
ncbi:hypothetical protein AB1N83_010477 [Pleurotus pulmonarius]